MTTVMSTIHPSLLAGSVSSDPSPSPSTSGGQDLNAAAMVMIKGSLEGDILQDTQYLSANCVLLIYYK